MAKKRIAPDTKARANTRTFRRILLLMVTLGALIFLPLFGKLYALQIVQHDELEKKAIDQQTKDIEVSASRGTIYDTNGNILAISASVHNVILSPRDIETNELDKEKIAYGLAPIIGREPEYLLERMERSNSAYEVVARKVEESVAEQVRAFMTSYNEEVTEYNKGKPNDEKKNKLNSGLYLMPDTKRYYPYSQLAAQVIGFVGTDNYGLYGMEALYENTLKGASGRVVTARTNYGNELPFRYEDMFDATPGSNLHLTLDTTIQHFAEKTLAEGIEEFEVQNGGFCIVMNPKTGAILAFANSPNYDLNDPSLVADDDVAAYLDTLEGDEYINELGQAQLNQWRNKALNDTYEPGSTFKSMVLAMALEEGVVNENDTFFCSGSVTIPGWPKPIYCHKHDGHGTQTLYQAVENSCNPAFIAIGRRVGAETFYRYLEDFGFLDTTGVDMQGEANSIIWSKDYFTSAEGAISLVTASFGQTMKVSPMQLITAASAAINGGHLMQPYVLDRITDDSGNVLQQTQPTEVRQVVSETTSAEVREVLEGVVAHGTGKNAYVAGYRIGGKTGTSQKRDEDSGNVIVSFLGFAPANDPEIVVLLAYDSPKPTVKGGNYTSRNWYIAGGSMAALKTGPLIADILDYMGIEKQYSASELNTMDILVPNIVGQTYENAKIALSQKGLDCRVIGEGDVVTAQIPASGTAIPGQSRVILYFGDTQPAESVTVPSVIGYGPEYARQVLQNAGLYMKTTGISETYSAATVASGQSIISGTEVKPGTVVEVNFSDKTLTD